VATTTATAIRDAMLTAAEALTPTSLSNTKFRRHREEIGLRSFASQNPAGCFRLLSIRDLFDFQEPRISDIVNEEVWTTFEVLVAYPTAGKGLYGAKQGLSLETVMEQDLHQLRHAIGANGYATLDTALSGAATVVEDGPDVEMDEGQPSAFVVLRLRTRYLRAM
jgi:hypothetical protein